MKHHDLRARHYHQHSVITKLEAIQNSPGDAKKNTFAGGPVYGCFRVDSLRFLKITMEIKIGSMLHDSRPGISGQTGASAWAVCVLWEGILMIYRF
jgi:hypothetical protein